MTHIKTRFLSVFLMASILSAVAANAAPTVKRLGTNAARIGGNTTTTNVNTSTASPVSSTQRLSSIRKTPTGTTAPITVNKVITPQNTTNEDARLGLGKYIHATGMATGNIKPVTPAPGPGVSSDDFINLTDRVSGLESALELKQNILTVGNGLTLENNTLELNSDVSQISEKLDTLQSQLDGKVSTTELDENYYNKYEVYDIINNRAVEEVDTIFDVATGTRRYVSIVDIFDTAILD